MLRNGADRPVKLTMSSFSCGADSRNVHPNAAIIKPTHESLSKIIGPTFHPFEVLQACCFSDCHSTFVLAYQNAAPIAFRRARRISTSTSAIGAGVLASSARKRSILRRRLSYRAISGLATYANSTTRMSLTISRPTLSLTFCVRVLVRLWRSNFSRLLKSTLLE